MTKDLFVRVFNELSRCSLEHYTANFIERLPLKLLEPAEQINPDVKRCFGYEQLREELTQSHQRRWRNPELFPYLNNLNVRSFVDLQGCVYALRTHVGLNAARDNALQPGLFWRLRDPKVKLLKQTGNGLKLIDEASITDGQSPFPVVYKPVEGLFSDIKAELYRSDSQITARSCLALAKSGMELLRRYSSELATGFCDEISIIAFMSESNGRARSFSMRNFFVGAVFVSVADPIVVAEQFLHEYYHQRIWPWW